MENSQGVLNCYFENPYYFWPFYKRSLFEILINGMIILGIIFSLAFFFLKIPILKDFAIFLVFFFVYTFFKKNKPEKYLDFKKLKNNINVSFFFSPSLKEVVIFAFNNFPKLKPEAGLLISLLKNKKIQENLSKLEIKSGELKEIIEKILSEFKLEEGERYSLAFKKELNNLCPILIKISESLNLNYINEEVLLLSLFELHEEFEEILSNYKINKDDIKTIFKLSLMKNKKTNVLMGLSALERNIFKEKEKIKVNPSLTSRPTPLLNLYSIDFTELAGFLKIGLMIGHQQEYDLLINTLTKEGKRNALLIGPVGVGKETIVSFLAYNIVRNNVPDTLKYHRLVCLSLSSFLSAEKDYVGVYNILKKIIEEIIVNKDLIIYFKDFYLFKSFSDKSGFSALDALQPLFDSPYIKVIADSPFNDYHRYLEHHPLIQENFEIIEVKEVKPEEALEILSFRSLEWEKKKKITISYKAIKRSIFLAERFFKNIPLPSSAENLLLETIEGIKRKGKTIVEENDVVNLVSLKTEIPLQISFEQEEKEKLLNLENLIHQYIVNQEEAVALVSSYLRQYRAGLTDIQKPIGVFLFVGPTGVGKTELSKTLTKVYFGSEKLMIRFDMSEYQDARSIFRFIGDPEGNIPGELTESVKRNPYSLILLDEFEKAHSKVLDLFLQVFDEGRLTDNFGEIIDFTHTIIIATSNARSDYIKEAISLNKEYEKIKEDFKKILLDYFKPELLNRFDEIIIFKPLKIEHLKEIVKLKLNIFKKQVKDIHSIELEFDENVIFKIAQLGYNPILGARPLNSVIRKYIKDPLAIKILSYKEKEKLSKKKLIFKLENEKIILKEEL